MQNLTLKGYATIQGTTRLANVYTNGDVYIRNYVGEFVAITRPTILEFFTA
tara:strand:+ start:427 stop:579 length:153 start_codon:yes stop_codon:yes gene_type:complete